MGNGEKRNDVGVDEPFEDVFIGYLPPLLLSEVFFGLELHSCERIKRVCVLWLQLLSNRGASEHIRICLDTCAEKATSGELNCYKTASLLSRTVRSTTKSLTIVKPFFPFSYLADLLEIMGIKLPAIIFKDFSITDSLNLYNRVDYSESPNRKLFAWHGATIWLDFSHNSCQRIVLHNWNLKKIFGRTVHAVFLNPFPIGRKILPTHEAQWIQPFMHESSIFWGDVLEIDKMQITIPKLILDCSQDMESMIGKFMWALDSNFPPIEDEVYMKVKNVHVRWVQTLAYPEEWETIRAYLSVFSGFHADGTLKCWNEIDLRCMEVCTLSRMALLGLAEIFRV
ncbi:uncharacterized protein LOC129587130 isoform X2 [Paramacrobiotus metropolitanus]|uniref:uncharacterized protein LOC129587130 isoform X2 n=1 Tax=Paramacrobiotus metropolitanus TaxID=2943436 RepID=UPI0024465775|nr:uncharacterized protein LOC129587130 isoform X2 [Paramacrobiotus metropolitanus]